METKVKVAFGIVIITGLTCIAFLVLVLLKTPIKDILIGLGAIIIICALIWAAVTLGTYADEREPDKERSLKQT